MRRPIKNCIRLFSILLIFLIFSGVITQAQTPPRFRIAHAAPGVSNVDVRMNGIISFRDIVYRQISDYIPVRPGDNTVEVKLTGPTPDTVVGTVGQPLGENQDYTLVIAGALGRVEWWPLQDNNELPGTGTSRVRIVHASYDTPTTEICLTDVCHTLTFKEDSRYFLMNPGIYAPKVHINSTRKVPVKIPPLLLQDNGVHTIFLTGQMDGQLGLQLLYTFDAGELADTYPPSDYPGGKWPGGFKPPAPVYPPVTGAFLSPRVIAMIVGAILILAGGIGFWLTRN